MKKISLIAMTSMMLMACTSNTISISLINDQEGMSMGSNVFPGVPEEVWNSLDDQTPKSSVSCVLLKSDGKSILFDAGMGSPSSTLIQQMKIHEVAPEELDMICLTHMHADHIGGLLADGKPVFPNAELYVNRLEADAWSADGQQKQVLDAYKDRLHLFDAGTELPGHIKTIAAYGHTPGHTVYQVLDCLIIGDIIHSAALQLKYPQYGPSFDSDQQAARDSRISILNYAKDNSLTMYGMHMSKPVEF